MDLFFVVLGLLLLAFPVMAIAALVKTVGLGGQLRRVEVRLAALERAAAAPMPGVSEQRAPAEPPAPTAPTIAQPIAVPPVVPPAPAAPDPAAPGEAEPASAASSPVAPPPPPTAPAGPAAPSMSLEERLGTQWAVWVGGLALALGGIFLVRYSIEQGLLGPGVRVTLGALLAAALVGAGEWARRSERLAGISGLPTAHIPSILTAAGTTVAYADVYAAHALYGFLAPGSAFVLLGLVALATLAAALLAWAGARGPRPRRRLCRAASGRLPAARLLVALRLSRGRDRGRLRARPLPDVALARHHGGRLQRAVDLARHRRGQRGCARRACLPRDRRLCARRDLDRRRPVVRTERVARPHRRRVIGGARRLPPRREPARAGEPARSARTRDLRRARGGDGRDRLARRGGGRGRAGGGGARRAGVRALGRRSQHRAPACAVRSGCRRRARAAESECRVASRAGSRLRGAVRRRRLSGAGTLGAGDRACPVERRGGVRADRDSRRALLPHRRVRAFDPVRGGRAIAERTLCIRHRDAG